MPKHVACVIPTPLKDIVRMEDLACEWQRRLENPGLQKRQVCQLRSIIQMCVTQLKEEKCEDLFEPFHDILRLGTHNISKSLEIHHQLLNEMLTSFLSNKVVSLGDLGKSVITEHEKITLVIKTLYGDVNVTVKRGRKGGCIKKDLQILIDLPQINEKGKKELPPLWADLTTSDKIDPSWFLFQDKDGMIKFGYDGKPQLADGARLSLWCDSNGEGLIVGTAHTTLKSDTTGQQDFVNYPLSKVFRLELENLPDDEVEILYTQVDELFEETLKTDGVKKFPSPTFLTTVAVMAGLSFIWFKR